MSDFSASSAVFLLLVALWIGCRKRLHKFLSYYAYVPKYARSELYFPVWAAKHPTLQTEVNALLHSPYGTVIGHALRELEFASELDALIVVRKERHRVIELAVRLNSSDTPRGWVQLIDLEALNSATDWLVLKALGLYIMVAIWYALQ